MSAIGLLELIMAGAVLFLGGVSLLRNWALQYVPSGALFRGLSGTGGSSAWQVILEGCRNVPTAVCGELRSRGRNGYSRKPDA